ncbi:MAG TPA: hypothetical protein VD996_06055 [Chitinophagaceae bacterium]|nr:hypothetical protein [Chitinophagaceae bacterium]
MSSKTYITIALDGKELKKYTTRINMLMTEDGVTRQMNTSTIMYFDKGALIKVEEFTQKDDLSKAFDWYFESGKPLYYTLPPDEVADERAEFLLSMADTVLKRVQ